MATINLREIPYEVIELVPESVAREHLILPLALAGDRLTVAYPHNLSDSELPELRDKLRFILNRPVDLIAMRREELQDAIDWHFRDGTIETCGGTRLRINYRCPRQWSQLIPTDDATVRYCTECQEPVYLCTTDDELVAHAQANHCVARESSEPFGEMLMGDIAIDFSSDQIDLDPQTPPPPEDDVASSRAILPPTSTRLLDQLRSLFRPVK